MIFTTWKHAAVNLSNVNKKHLKYGDLNYNIELYQIKHYCPVYLYIFSEFESETNKLSIPMTSSKSFLARYLSCSGF